jgi:hypothetical protein
MTKSFKQWLSEDVPPTAVSPSVGGSPTPQIQQQNLQKTQQTQLNRTQSLQKITQGLQPVFQSINGIADPEFKQQLLSLYSPFAQSLAEIK